MLKRRLEVVGRTRLNIEGKKTLMEVVLARNSTNKFTLVDNPQDGIFPNDSDGLIDVIFWHRRYSSAFRYRGQPKYPWRKYRLSPETDSKAYEEGTRKFLKVKDLKLQLGDHVR